MAAVKQGAIACCHNLNLAVLNQGMYKGTPFIE
jgi:hypothetical protein